MIVNDSGKHLHLLALLLAVTTPLQTGSMFATSAEAAEPEGGQSASTINIVHQPYLQQVDSDSAVVVWATRELGPAQVRYRTGSGAVVTAIATSSFYPASTTGMAFDYYQYEAPLRPLTPSTLYIYDAFVDGIDLPGSAQFTTAPVPGTGTVRFLAFGDSGTGSPAQRQLASRMLTEVFDLALHTGDVAYGDGTYRQFHDFVFEIYKGWFGSRPFFPSIGNHDDATAAARPYRELFVLPPHGATAGFPDHAERFYSFDYGPVHFVALDSELAFQDPSRRAAQLSWLEADLSSTTQPWRIAFFHRPPYNAGPHGSSIDIREAFGPLFERYGVQLVITGHEHDYERTVPLRLSGNPADQAVTYVVTGGGGADLHFLGSGQAEWTVTSRSAHHYVRATVNGCVLAADVVGVTGALFDQFVLDRCEQARDAAPPAVSISAPSNATTVVGSVSVDVDASDDIRVEKVDLFVDGVFAGIDHATPYQFLWDTTSKPDGVHTLEARAYDIDGNVTRSPVVAVNVSNGINVAAAANGGVARASSSYSGSYPPSGAIDGERRGLNWGAGGGWNDATPNAYPDWLQVDFSGAKWIDEINVIMVQDNYTSPSEPTASMTASFYVLTSFTVQYWNGSAWAAIPGGVVTGNQHVMRTFRFSSINTDRIRVLVTNARGSYSRLVEVEALEGPPGTSPPTVVITQPAANQTFTLPPTITVRADASDSDGSITQVAFYVNGQLLVTDPTSPYEATWNNPVPGVYEVVATATDNFGATTSDAINVTVFGSSTVGNVASAANGAVARASSSYSSSYPPSGAIDGERRGLNWGAGGGWNDATPNAYPDWLQIDFAGTKWIDEISLIMVQDNYTSPSEPTPAMTFSLYGLTDFTVQYWNGGAWAAVPGGVVAGNHQVMRTFSFAPIVTDSIRVLVTNARASYSRIVEVEAFEAASPGTSAPTVAITEPAPNDTFTLPASITMAATASDSDGSITHVAFYVDGTLLATDTTSPYEAVWSSPTPGMHELLAIATDNLGATASDAIDVTVYGSSTSGNVAAAANGGIARASSSYSSSYPATGVIDGEHRGLNWGTGGGWNDATGNLFPDWVEVSFSEPATITEVSVFTVQDNYTAPIEPDANMTFSAYGLTHFDVQYWNGTEWVTVPGGSVANNRSVWRRFTFGAITTTKVRVLVTHALAGYARVVEIEVY